MIERLDSTNWYDDVVALAIQGGDFTLTSGTSPKTLVVYAVKNNGDAPFVPPYADLTFSSGTTSDATIGTNTGIVTWVSTGGSLLTVVITAKPDITDSCTVTCS